MRKSIRVSRSLALVLMAALVLLSAPAHAATVWTDWTDATAGTPGSAAGSLGGVGVSYSGRLIGSNIAGTTNIWAPGSTFVGGTVTTSPSVVGDDLRTDGFFTGINSITFDSAVENPVFAIWSLGSPSIPATFMFDATPVLQVGGPNSIYGGSSITISGNTVSGFEGNGVVQFNGTFTSISWTNTPENYYSFTVGVNGTAAIPEPSSLSLLLVALGFAGAGVHKRFRSLR